MYNNSIRKSKHPPLDHLTYPDNICHDMLIANPTYDQHIIKPHKHNVTHGRIVKRLFIDSRDRNCDVYPNPASYQLEIPDMYRDVISINLVKGMIPKTEYIINEHCNRIYFQETENVMLCARIPVGDYKDPVSFASAIEDALDDAPNADSKYTVSIDTKLTNKMTIISDLSGGENLFNIIVWGSIEKYGLNQVRQRPPKASMLRKMGFTNRFNLGTYEKGGTNLGRISTESGSDIITGHGGTKFTKIFEAGDKIAILCRNEVYDIVEVISDTEIKISVILTFTISPSICCQYSASRYTSPSKIDLCPESYIIMSIRDMEHIDSYTNSASDSFSIIPLHGDQNSKNFIDLRSFGHSMEIKHFNPPLPRFWKFEIRFIRYDGELYDFQGQEHFLEFDIITMNQNGKYTTER